MPRKALKPREKRGMPNGDSMYNSVIVARFINKLDHSGKKNVAEKIMSTAFNIVKEKMGEEPLEVFNRAIENARPLLEVRPRRVGGATYQVPMEVPMVRSTTREMNWIMEAARSKTGRPMADRLAQEFMDASKKEGSVMKKREDTHKMAEANKAFAHYKW